MKVLVACEFSGTVREAFAKRGHNAWSCDLLPTDIPGQHLECDVLSVLKDNWDLIIGHPPCTYLCNSGVRHLYSEKDRWNKLWEACDFFVELWNAPCKYVCLENPIPHAYARSRIGKYDQIINPWQFGHGETKKTCLWLKGLPKLIPTNIVSGRVPRIHKISPSANRWKLRSKTYQGFADAMAEQWGNLK